MKYRSSTMGIVTAGVFCVLLMVSGCSKSSGIYQEGTYTAAAEGYGGDVTVEVSFDSQSIQSVTVTEHKETEGLGDKAVTVLPDKITEAQTYDVDSVSTATLTSEAIKAAVKDCMEQAAAEE